MKANNKFKPMSATDIKTIKEMILHFEKLYSLFHSLSPDAMINTGKLEKGIKRFTLPVQVAAYKGLLDFLITDAVIDTETMPNEDKSIPPK